MRKEIDLCRNWEFALQRGEETLHYQPVTLPHDWAVVAPFNQTMDQGEAQGFRDRWGIGWYRRVLHITKQAEYCYLLCFDGVYENSAVWVNDACEGGQHRASCGSLV